MRLVWHDLPPKPVLAALPPTSRMARLKISYPVFRQPSCVTLGTGALRTLGEAPQLDQTFFFLTSQREACQAVQNVLNSAGLALAERNSLVKPAGEPTVEMVRLGANSLRRGPHRRIVAIGGGSVLDWARLAWTCSQELLDFDTGRVSASETRPELWLIPTTCGSGAEAAGVAVFLNHGRKVAAVSPTFVADQVILDGRFLETVSESKLACSLCDALSHAIESFTSIVPNYLAKEMALAALDVILTQYGADATPSRRDRLMEAGYLGGLAASHCSVGVTHAFAHAAAAFGLGHGLANALGLIPGVEANQETDSLRLLLRRMGWQAPGELVNQLMPVVQAAIHSRTDLVALKELTQSAARGAFLECMQADVCLRTNPQQLSVAQLDRFLDRTLEIVETAA